MGRSIRETKWRGLSVFVWMYAHDIVIVEEGTEFQFEYACKISLPYLHLSRHSRLPTLPTYHSSLIRIIFH